MNQMNNLPDAQNADSIASEPRQKLIMRIATGAAVVALPVAAGTLYIHTEKSSSASNRELEKKFKYDISRLQQVDPSLIKYKQAGKIDTGMAAPRAMVLDGSGNLVVAGDRLVRVLGMGGNVARDIKLASTPYSVAVAEDGAIFVGFKDHVEIFSPAGKQLMAWSSLGKDAYLTGIAVSGDHVYLADSGRRMVLHADRTGKIINEIGKPDPSRGQEGLLLPSPHLDVAVAADGTVWLNDTGRHRLENYTPDGRLERFWGVQGNGIEAFPGCCNPTDFVLLKDGSFITAEKGIARIKHYLPDGRFDCVVAPPSAFGQNILGLDVVVDGSGRVLTLERGTSIVHVFAKVEENPQ